MVALAREGGSVYLGWRLLREDPPDVAFDVYRAPAGARSGTRLGAIAIDNDGRTMWGTGNGHGDRFYLTDVDPDRPALEVLSIHEDPQLTEALVGDIDPTHPGMECWAAEGHTPQLSTYLGTRP